MSPLLLVMAGGAVGAGARHLAGQGLLRVAGPGWPWGTLAVNICGGLLMGMLVGWLAREGGSDATRLLLGVGVLGGFTTFSAFSLEVVLMIQRGAWGAAMAYVALSVAGSVVTLLLGLQLMRVPA